jgi:hypothetical protein
MKGLLLLAVVALAWVAVACNDDPPAPDPGREAHPVTQAKPAASFRDSVGVNVRTAFEGTPYADYPRVKAALLYTGIRHIRDGLWPEWLHTQRAFFRELAAAGIKYTLGLGGLAFEHELDAKLDLIREDGLRPGLAALENPNEVNWKHSEEDVPADWAARTRAYARHLWDSSRDLDVPVIGPSLGGRHDEEQVGDISPWVDWGNIHPYRGPGIPETAVREETPYAREMSAGKPVSITEFGWALADWAPDERAQASYTLRAFLDHYAKGIPRSYVHQLVDLRSEQEYLAGNPDDPVGARRDATFGLYRHDWTPRQVADALHNLNTAIGDGGRAAPLELAVKTGPPDLRKVVLTRADGEFVIVLWRAAPAGARSAEVGLSLPTATAVSATRPVTSSSESTLALDTGQVTVGVDSEPVVLRVTP